MVSRVGHRIASVVGAAIITTVAMVFANLSVTQHTLTTVVPVISRLRATTLTNSSLVGALLLANAVVLLCLAPLFKPRPRRVLDTIFLTEKRVLLAICSLATIGYFDYSYRFPRPTLILLFAVLVVLLPVWFTAIRRPPGEAERSVIIGDDPEKMESVLETLDTTVLGYVSPPNPYEVETRSSDHPELIADGQGESGPLQELDCLGDLSKLDDILINHDIDTAVLAFTTPSRAGFFGTLGTCHEHGVEAKVHREHMDSVLTSATTTGSEALVDIDLEPWDWQDHVWKRLFDVTFAAFGLVLLAPVMAVIAVAIKLDSPGPLLYSQERTAEFGDTFEVYKFRSMIPNAEADTGATLSQEDAGEVDPRVTSVGRVLRQTHLDEIPQLWSILLGDMSVVGPRPERPELDTDIENEMVQWRQRWFVKPGLTGLAQINDVTGHEPERKLRYDIEYIRRQSFWFDLQIVIRQLWEVVLDLR